MYEKQFIQPTFIEGKIQIVDKQNYITKIPFVETNIHSTNELNVMTLPNVLNETTKQLFTMRISLPKADEIYSLQLRGLTEPFTMFIDGQRCDASKQFNFGKTINFYAPKKVTTIELLVTPVNGRIGFLQAPTIAPLDTMQRFIFKQFAMTLMILCSFLFVSLYSFGIYAQKRFVFQLQISLYFIFISC